MPSDVEKKRVKNIKNYFILIGVFIAIIIMVLYLCDCYRVYNESKKEIPVLEGILSEISIQELEHYILENPTTVIYICTVNNDVCRDYEGKLIKLINKKDLSDDIVYLNVLEDQVDDFVNDFNSRYPYKVELNSNFPAYVVFDEGSISSLLQEKDKKLSIEKTRQFIELNKIGE